MRFVEKRAALRIQSNVRSGRFDEVGRIMFLAAKKPHGHLGFGRIFHEVVSLGIAIETHPLGAVVIQQERG